VREKHCTVQCFFAQKTLHGAVCTFLRAIKKSRSRNDSVQMLRFAYDVFTTSHPAHHGLANSSDQTSCCPRKRPRGSTCFFIANKLEYLFPHIFVCQFFKFAGAWLMPTPESGNICIILSMKASSQMDTCIAAFLNTGFTDVGSLDSEISFCVPSSKYSPCIGHNLPFAIAL